MNVKGSYALLVEVNEELRGRWHLGPGYYLYIGSARGSGGLVSRISRHFSTNKKLRWHIDYVLAEGATPLIAFLFPNLTEDELYELVSTSLEPAIEGFGCTDKPSHLTHLFKVRESELKELLELWRKSSMRSS